jgi:hypothetical protein
MELLRVTRDVWGRQVLEGISWDLLPVAVGVGAAVIIVHAIVRLFRKNRRLDE